MEKKVGTSARADTGCLEKRKCVGSVVGTSLRSPTSDGWDLAAEMVEIGIKDTIPFPLASGEASLPPLHMRKDPTQRSEDESGDRPEMETPVAPNQASLEGKIPDEVP